MKTKKTKLKDVALIVETVNRYGQKEAAKQFGISQAAVSYWLNANGYIKQWVKQKDAS